jgi:hypothetical protein
MELVTGLVIVGTVAALLHWVASRRTVALLDLFGSGFLPCRIDDRWPQGVQEAEPVPWSWSTTDEPGPEAEQLIAASANGAELVEINRSAAPPASPVRRERMGAGSASRAH